MNTQSRPFRRGQHQSSSFNRFQNRRGPSSQRRPMRSRNRFSKESIDERRFINKAVHQEVKEYVPTHRFSDFAIHPTIKENLKKLSFEHPSAIQDQSIPVILKGHDVIGIAQTGTGKTAAFLLPIITRLVEPNAKKAIIMTPTRELAIQIESAFRSFSQSMRLFSVTCVGGAPMGRQIQQLHRGVSVVIGTPGRIKDLIQRGHIKTDQFDVVVLDEADRMLDMGFIHDMKAIIHKIPQPRQCLFFSATFSEQIKSLCKEFLNNPQTIQIPARDTSSRVEQDVVRVKHGTSKVKELATIVSQPDCSRVLVFCEMKRSVDTLVRDLSVLGFKVFGLHGDMRNRQRERAVAALARGEAHIVIATDVAARGIDIPDITHVINFDVPSSYDTYIHRIGRTGRANKTGVALTFI